MSDWETVPLGELCEFSSGTGFPKVHQGATRGEIPFVKVSDMSLIGNEVAFHTANHWISREVASLIKAKPVAPGATVFAKIGEALRAERLRKVVTPTAIDNNLMAAIPRGEKVDANFLYFLLKTVGLSDWAEGSAMPYLRQGDLKRIPVTVPRLAEQRRIAAILSAMDDLMERNLRIRDLMDEKGRHLLTEVLGHRNDGQSGWAALTLGEAASLIETGMRPAGGVGGFTDGTPSIGAESIRGLGLFDFSKVKYVPTSFADKMPRGHIESRDVLIYKDGGKPGEFRPHVSMFGDGYPFENMTINSHVYRVRAMEPLTESFLYFWLSSPSSMERMAVLGTGAAIPGINSTALRTLPVPVPPAHVRDRLFPVLDLLVGEALAAVKEARRVSVLRDRILKPLLSRQISLRMASV